MASSMHKDGLLKKKSSLIGAILLFVSFILFTLIILFPNWAYSPDGSAKESTNITLYECDDFRVYYTPSTEKVIALSTEKVIAENTTFDRVYKLSIIFIICFVLFLTLRWLWEKFETESFFSVIFGVISTVVLFSLLLTRIGDFYNFIGGIHILLFIVAVIAEFTGLLLFFGALPPASKDAITYLSFQMTQEEERTNWIQGNQKMLKTVASEFDDTPLDFDHSLLDVVEPSPLDKLLIRFMNGHGKYYNKQIGIVIGGFGSGKSSALIRCASSQLKGINHNHTLNIYVRLRDWFSPDDLDHFCNSPEKVDPQKLREQLINTVLPTSFPNVTESVSEIIGNLYQKQKIVFIFDGLNEVIQVNCCQDNSDSKESNITRQNRQKQMVRNISSFLHDFANGNRYIIAFCPMHGIITNESIGLTSASGNHHIIKVEGVNSEEINNIADSKVLEDGSDFVQFIQKIQYSPALCRLAMNFHDTKNTEKMTNEQNTKSYYSVYSLLELYINNQIDRFVVGYKKDDLKAFLMSFGIDVENPYSPFTIENRNGKYEQYLRAMVRSKLLRKNSDNGQYSFCHILILEFVLAQMIDSLLADINNKEKISNILIGSFSAITPPLFLQNTNAHLRAVIEILFSYYASTNNTNNIETLIKFLIRSVYTNIIQSNDESTADKAILPADEVIKSTLPTGEGNIMFDTIAFISSCVKPEIITNMAGEPIIQDTTNNETLQSIFNDCIKCFKSDINNVLPDYQLIDLFPLWDDEDKAAVITKLLQPGINTKAILPMRRKLLMKLSSMNSQS